MKKINVITLGCSKNTVDSEHLMARLAAAGYEVLFDSDRTDAKVVVINTCGFIGDAKQESVDMILRAAAAKQAGKIERLFVVGCLSERYADELRAEIPEVDEYFGARTWDGIVRALGASEDPALATERRLTTPRHYAYLKISEGCNWKCGYCAIPLIRGAHVSVPMEVLEEEARKLAAQGVREVMVIAQDTTYYGIDLYGRRMLAELLRRLCRIDGIEWLRLHYAYPTGFPEEVIEVMAAEPKICKYLDIPFQHISDAQLAAMHRRHTKAEAMELIRRLRTAIPDLALRTTLLVGYPGETGADFVEQLLHQLVTAEHAVSLPTGMHVVTTRQGDQRLHHAAQFLGFGLGGVDAAVREQGLGHVAEQGLAMGRIPAQFSAGIVMPHGAASSSIPDISCRTNRPSCRNQAPCREARS